MLVLKKKVLLFSFFFSSRRRHTRSLRDWSSDVCSSDLGPALDVGEGGDRAAHARGLERRVCGLDGLVVVGRRGLAVPGLVARRGGLDRSDQIGRASCRERG